MAYRNYDPKKQVTSSHKTRVRTRLRILVLEYLVTHPCIDCQEGDPLVLEFDHVRGDKIASVAQLINRGAKWNVIWDEIQKCDVRCANCHARKTAKQLGYWQLLNQTT